MSAALLDKLTADVLSEQANLSGEELLARYKESGDENLKWEIVLRYEHIVKYAAMQVRGIYSSLAFELSTEAKLQGTAAISTSSFIRPAVIPSAVP